jgi:hypothetical protein
MQPIFCTPDEKTRACNTERNVDCEKNLGKLFAGKILDDTNLWIGFYICSIFSGSTTFDVQNTHPGHALVFYADWAHPERGTLSEILPGVILRTSTVRNT